MLSLDQVVGELQSWAQLHDRCQAARIDWSAVDDLILAATHWSDECGSHLSDVLSESERRLSPLEDPLRTDLGLHRWLTSRREENYSDWLAWILQQLKPDEILTLLRVDTNNLGHVFRPSQVQVDREFSVPGGRLDIQIAFDSELLIILEIKKTSADEADTDKQEGYADYARRGSIPTRKILLVTEAAKDRYPGDFTPYSWADLCIELRRLLPVLIRPRIQGGLGVAKSAMIAAFIAATEQNLVGLTTNNNEVRSGSKLFAVPRTVDHIRQSLSLEGETC